MLQARKGAAALIVVVILIAAVIVIVIIVPIVAARCHHCHPQLMFVFIIPSFSHGTLSLVHLPFDTGLLPVIVILHLSLGAESLHVISDVAMSG